MQLENLTEKQLLQVWEDFITNVRKQTAVAMGETEEAKKKRIKRLEANPEEWFKWYFPKESECEPALFHRATARMILTHLEFTLVRIWSRELAKSTRTMMEVMYLILTGKKRYVLMISNSYDNAERLLMPYRAHLTANEKIINDYGFQELPGYWTASEFTTRKGVAFRALGAGQSPRGTRNEEVRPDVILFDDIDTDEECRNPEIIKKKWMWIENAAIPTRSVSKATTIIFNGNRIAKDCCVERACKIADHVSEINIRDRNGKSTWPEKNTEAHIDRVLKQKSYASAQREYFNNPIDEGSVFKELAYKPARRINEYKYLVCYTDPSFKDSKKNDYKATVLVGKWKDEFHVIKAFVEQTSTANMIQWHYNTMDIVNNAACYYLMEEVFLQDIILKEFYDASAKTGRSIPITGDKRQKPDKFTRIESLLEPLNRNGKLFLNEAERNNPHMVRLEDQFKAFAPGSRAHDDAPDAVEGAVYIINSKCAAIEQGGIHLVRRNHNSKRF